MFPYIGRTRLKLSSPNPEGRNVGFVTINCWSFDNIRIPGSADSTPLHSTLYKVSESVEIKIIPKYKIRSGDNAV